MEKLTDNEILNKYNQVAPDDLSKTRSDFIDRFGIDKLKLLDDKELVKRLFAGANAATRAQIGRRGLFSWLEHGDEGVPKGTFGYARDSANQWGILLSYKNSAFEYKLYTNTSVIISELQAIEYACSLRDYLDTACGLLANKSFATIEDYEYTDNALKRKYADINNPYWSRNGELKQCLLKYLHILFPDKICEFYSPDYQYKIAETIGASRGDNGKLCNNGYIMLRIKELTNESDSCRFAKAVNPLVYKKNNASSSVVVKMSDQNNSVNLNDINKNKHALNTIFYGPPGTGKTYNTVSKAIAIIDNGETTELTEDEYSEQKARFDGYIENGQIAFTTFHQSYGYEEFIEGIKPDLKRVSGDLRYELADGVFKRFCAEAGKPENNSKNYVFIIDEINRGNVSKIFGELITLIEPSKRLGMSEAHKCTLPYSGERFGVPKNVYILGTMNTADRSLVQLDTALRRRFVFEEMMPRYNVFATDAVDEINISELLKAINEKICVLLDREHQIGHSYFMKLTENSSFEDLKNIFERNIVPLLQEYFYDDYNSIKSILGEKFVSEVSVKVGGETKTRVELTVSNNPFDYIKIYGGSAGDGSEQDR